MTCKKAESLLISPSLDRNHQTVMLYSVFKWPSYVLQNALFGWNHALCFSKKQNKNAFHRFVVSYYGYDKYQTRAE